MEMSDRRFVRLIYRCSFLIIPDNLLVNSFYQSLDGIRHWLDVHTIPDSGSAAAVVLGPMQAILGLPGKLSGSKPASLTIL